MTNILTTKETKILKELALGSLYKEIAAHYKISVNTVKKHLKNVYRKLQVCKRTDAMKKFSEITSHN